MEERRKKKPKAIVLCSGGLDSTIAARWMKEMGFEVKAIHFSTGFCVWDHHRRMGGKDPNYKKGKVHGHPVLQAAAGIGVPVEMYDISQEYHHIVMNPKYGRGNAANPCIDCRIFMLKKAKEIMEAEGADCVVTGEVLGQRPMSQHRAALNLIEKESGLDGRLLRPLSARHLKPTLLEEKGYLTREQLLQFSGRGRQGQLALAKRWGISGYAPPGGGCCFLADENFARKFRDLLKYQPKEKIQHEDLWLLKIGRHFRLSSQAKLILGRHEGENTLLRECRGDRWWLNVKSHPGPFGLMIVHPQLTESPPSELSTAGRIAAYYSDGRHTSPITIEYGLGSALHSLLAFSSIDITPDLLSSLHI